MLVSYGSYHGGGELLPEEGRRPSGRMGQRRLTEILDCAVLVRQ